MKKILLVLASTLVLVFSACSQINEEIEPSPTAVRDESFGFWNLYQQPDIEFEDLYEHFRALLLEDFDFLAEKMQTYLPHFGIIYRRRGSGSDLNRILLRHRESIENNSLFFAGNRAIVAEELPRRVATGFLNGQISPLQSVGLAHIMPVDQNLIQYNYFLCLTHQETIVDNSFCEMISNVSTRNFYQLELVDATAHDENPLSQWDENNLRIEILVPDEIAYVSFNHFFNFSPENILLDQNILFPFYYEIQNFNHLIFDFRGHFGGFTNIISELIIGPLIKEPLEGEIHQFVRGHVLERLDNQDEFFNLGFISLDDSEVFSASDFARERGMVHFNQADLELLDYAVVTTYTIEPVEADFNFDGKIWILVDGRTASAGELAALFAMNTGFATVVGTNTMGIMPAATAHVVLPNTGIVFRFDVGYFTDAYGRSLEEFGITPNYLNRPGMDALQTVLAMIEEIGN